MLEPDLGEQKTYIVTINEYTLTRELLVLVNKRESILFNITMFIYFNHSEVKCRLNNILVMLRL